MKLNMQADTGHLVTGRMHLEGEKRENKQHLHNPSQTWGLLRGIAKTHRKVVNPKQAEAEHQDWANRPRAWSFSYAEAQTY